MATIAETVTRLCDDLSRPENEIGTVAQREILSAIEFYSGKRFGFNERILAFTLSATMDYAFSVICAPHSLSVVDIIEVDDIKVTQGGREIAVDRDNYGSIFRLDQGAPVNANLPDYWGVFNKTVRFYPTPNQSLTCQVAGLVKLVPLLSVAGAPTSNDWLVAGEELIRARATWACLTKKLDDFEKGSLYKVMEQEAFKDLHEKAVSIRSAGKLAANY